MENGNKQICIKKYLKGAVKLHFIYIYMYVRVLKYEYKRIYSLYLFSEIN